MNDPETSLPPPSRRSDDAGVGVPKRLRRRIRTSRLDFCCNESSINMSEFRGFLNLFNIAMALFLIADPIIRYQETGLFIDPSLAKVMFRDVHLLLWNWLQCFLWSFTSYFTHRLLVKGYINRPLVRVIQHTSQAALIAYAVALCRLRDWGVLPSGFTLIVAFIFAMKMHSFTESLLEMHTIRAQLIQKYALTGIAGSPDMSRTPLTQSQVEVGTPLVQHLDKQMSELRQRKLSELLLEREPDMKGATRLGSKSHQELQQILDEDLAVEPSMGYYVYYLFCPILVYEGHYPRGRPFSLSYFILKIIGMIGAMVALYFISVRHLIPVLAATAQWNFVIAFLKLLFPILCCTLLTFYILFECICNLLAEVTAFGDREFYSDWWNSTTWDEFSRKWNRPVHEFLLRHLYYQFVHQWKFSKLMASGVTFLFSAVLHELIMAVCFKMIRFWFFALILLQIPLIEVGERHRDTLFGNCIFWFGIMVGLPFLTVLYGREQTSAQAVS